VSEAILNYVPNSASSLSSGASPFHFHQGQDLPRHRHSHRRPPGCVADYEAGQRCGDLTHHRKPPRPQRRGAVFNNRFLGGFPRWRCGVDIIITPIGGLQDALWIARWDRGVVIRLVLNLLNLDGGASLSWCWCWFSSWLFCRVHRGPSRRAVFW
jgi:hypothetical protein